MNLPLNNLCPIAERNHLCVWLVALLLAATSAAAQSSSANTANPADYLAEVCQELGRQWPANRTINVVCHGHSVPAGYFKTPVVDTFNAYPHLLHRGLKEQFPFAVINVTVTAIGGEDSEQGARRFERDVLALRPAVVTIDYSLNDRRLGLARAEAAWRSMITNATARGIKVILLTPTPDLAARLGDPAEPLEQHAAQVRRLAQELGTGLVDSLAACQRAGNAGRPLGDLMSQGNHPNRAGHELVAAELQRWFPAAAAERPPNVLLIISDDQAWSDYGFMGHPHLQTPHLDRLAGESLTFLRGYTPVPLCRPALASIATGLHPHQHGVTGNDPDLPDVGVNAMAARTNPQYARYYERIIDQFARRPNLVRDLTGRGYAALQTGKWWEGDPVQTAGFTHAMTRGVGQGGRHGDTGLEIGRKGLEPVYRFIAEAGERPWLVWYAPFLPHDPHNPPAELLEKYRKVAPTEAVARYWGNVEWFDRTCGELLAHLETSGQRSNTIVLYTTDNGWIQDPDRPNRFAPRSKNTAYEGGVRTPIMVSWPGRIAPRKDAEHLASNVDLWPTLAALLKFPTPTNLPGINLTDPRARAGRSFIAGAQYAHNIADVDQPTRSVQARWIIDGEWKLIVPDPRHRPADAVELYQVVADPWERTDRAPAEPERVAALRQRLDAWWTPAGRGP